MQAGPGLAGAAHAQPVIVRAREQRAERHQPRDQGEPQHHERERDARDRGVGDLAGDPGGRREHQRGPVRAAHELGEDDREQGGFGAEGERDDVGWRSDSGTVRDGGG